MTGFNHSQSNSSTAFRRLLMLIPFVLFPLKGFAEPHYTIRNIDITTTGLTKPYALQFIVPSLREGISFPSEKLLLAFLQNIYDTLNDTRTLQKVYVDHRLTILNSKEIAADVAIHTVDSWNLIVLPYPKYDDNTGFSLSARVRDYNFLGSQQTSSLDVDYEYLWSGGHGVRTNLHLNHLFPLHSQSLLSSFQLETKYNEAQRLRVGNNIGLGYPFRVLSLPWTVNYTQGTFYTENPQDANSLYGKSIFGLNGPLYLGLTLPSLGKLIYTPSWEVDTRYTYRDPLTDDIKGTQMGFSHRLSLGTVRWKKNFRDGYLFSVTNSNYYNPVNGRWSILLSPSAEGHFVFRTIELSFRVLSEYIVNSTLSSPGKYLRGILNNALTGNFSLIANLDLRIYLFTIGTLFEGQASLFTDVGFVYPTDQTPLIADHLRYTVGIEGLLFTLFSRSFFIRISWGVDLSSLISETPKLGIASAFWRHRELFIGIGFHY